MCVQRLLRTASTRVCPILFITGILPEENGVADHGDSRVMNAPGCCVMSVSCALRCLIHTKSAFETSRIFLVLPGHWTQVLTCQISDAMCYASSAAPQYIGPDSLERDFTAAVCSQGLKSQRFHRYFRHSGAQDWKGHGTLGANLEKSTRQRLQSRWLTGRFCRRPGKHDARAVQ